MSTHPLSSAAREGETVVQENPPVDELPSVLTILPNQSPGSPPGTPKLLRVVESLIAIDTSEKHKRALEDSTNEATIKASRIQELESRSDKLKTVIFQVMGFFLVFQGAMITVVAQSTVLQQDNRWIPMALSGAAAVSCIFPVWQKGWEIAHIQGDMHDEENERQAALIARAELRRVGVKYSFPTLRGRISKKRSKYFYFLPYFLILAFIIGFTVLIMYSQWRIRSEKISPSTVLAVSSPQAVLP